MKTPQKLDFKHFFFTRLVQRTPPPLFVQGWILLQACDYITSHLWCSFISQALLSQLFEEPPGAFDLSVLSGRSYQLRRHICAQPRTRFQSHLSLSGLTGSV